MPRLRYRLAAVCLLASAMVPAAPGQINITFEAPGVQHTTLTGAHEMTFDTTAAGQTSFAFDAGGTTYGTYTAASAINIGAANQYGGSGGNTNFLTVGSSNPVTLSLTNSEAYFGAWWSAANGGNKVDFYSGSTLKGSFTTSSLLSSPLLSGNAAYKGNPNAAFLGQNSGEVYVFINFYAATTADKFDKIVFSETGGGFEVDNHTVRETIAAPGEITGTPVPEPAGLLAVGAVGLLVAWGRRR